MAPASTKQIDQDTRDKVNRIDQRVEEVVLPALEGLQTQMTKLSVVSLAEYSDNKIKTDAEIAELKKFKQDAEPAIKFFNLLNSRWTNILIGAIILAALYAIFSQIGKIGIL